MTDARRRVNLLEYPRQGSNRCLFPDENRVSRLRRSVKRSTQLPHGCYRRLTRRGMQPENPCKRSSASSDRHRGSSAISTSSYFLGRLYNRVKKAHGGDRKSSAQTEPLKTAERLAAEHGVSPATVKRAAKFAEQVDANPVLAAGKGDQSEPRKTAERLAAEKQQGPGCPPSRAILY